MLDPNTIANDKGTRKTVMREALEAIESLQAQLDRVERARTEPIAIVGLSCRFPGSENPDAFWRLLSSGTDAVKEAPRDRWNKAPDYSADPTVPGTVRKDYGGFLDHIDRFDAAFFGISGREAEHMDPQQRLLLEVAWEALENAGIAADHLRGTPVGVFLGITRSNYAHAANGEGVASLDTYTAAGGAPSVAAGRLSYIFGLSGPSIAIDTACSSSLVALHLACQSLRARECDSALAGAVNMLLTPEPFICLSKMGLLAEDGRCRTFDEQANGFGRGEGCGLLILKRLSDALEAEDRILALIRGTAVNQDGVRSGLTIPNGLAQQAVIRTALNAAHLQPHDIDYVEAMGTGTAIGDSVELEALAAALAKNRPTSRPLRVGSVKTNIGHLEQAAGIAGLIKVVLSMEHGEIPPHLHFRKLNPQISLNGAPIEIPVEPTAWPRSDRPRIAGVSSFGLSGTNAHLILQEAPLPAEEWAKSSQLPDRPVHLMVLSADSDAALRELSRAYAKRLGEADECSLADICHTAASGRSARSHRLAFPAPNITVAGELLSAFAQAEPKTEILSGRAGLDCKVAFLFPGHGTQYAGMARALYQSEPVFRDRFDRCALLLRQHLDRPLQEIVAYETAGNLDDTLYAEPALFAIEYALAALWCSWGIEPVAIIGHGLGEYVGACVAGALRLEDALSLVTLRARLMRSLPDYGAVASVFACEDRVKAVTALYADSVSIAQVNSPQNTVIAGKEEAIHAALERLCQEGVESKLLNSSLAFHSPLVEPILDEFERSAARIENRVPVVDLVSNITGASLEDPMSLNANYWRNHMRRTVRFAQSVQSLHTRGIRTFLEIGPAAVLSDMAKQCVGDSGTTFLTSLHKDRNDWAQMLPSLGALFVLGAKPNWRGFDQAHRRRRVALPTYRFQRERHWFPVSPEVSMRERTGASWTPEEATKGEGREHFLGSLSEIYHETVKSYLAQRLARILKVPLGSVEGETSILKLGFDSLVAIEFKNWIETDLGISVGMDRLVQGPTLLELTDLVADRLKAAQASCAPPSASPSVEEFEEGVV